MANHKKIEFMLHTSEKSESGYISAPETDCYIGSEIRDVEVIRITRINIIARGRRYGRQWLLKGLCEELRDSAIMQRQLQKEFELHSRLRHPSVVQVVGFENVEGLGRCIIQEWIEGMTLKEALQKEELSYRERQLIIRELIAAVAYIHSCGVVHRDLKPTNIMLRNIGREVVIVDFGLADSADYVEIKQPAGTPGFISPEQEISGGADPADDVYSIGVIIGDVFPNYGSLRQRCIGPPARRPKDANNLLKAFNRRCHLPKMIALSAAVLIAVILVAVAAIRFVNLNNSAYESAKQIAELSEKNARDAKLVSTLEDSLVVVQGRLNEAEKELTIVRDYENLKSALLNHGYENIDNVLRRYDREKFSDINDGTALEYSAILGGLLDDLRDCIEKYMVQISGQPLKPEDLTHIRSSLYNYMALELDKNQQLWLKKIGLIS